MGEDGFYRLYKVVHYDDGRTGSRLVGRFEVMDGIITILEDHDGNLEEIFPNGPLEDRELRAMQSMSNSPYWDLVKESPVVAS
jgi:hypothetical protein